MMLASCRVRGGAERGYGGCIMGWHGGEIVTNKILD